LAVRGTQGHGVIPKENTRSLTGVNGGHAGVVDGVDFGKKTRGDSKKQRALRLVTTPNLFHAHGGLRMVKDQNNVGREVTWTEHAKIIPNIEAIGEWDGTFVAPRNSGYFVFKGLAFQMAAGNVTTAYQKKYLGVSVEADEKKLRILLEESQKLYDIAELSSTPSIWYADNNSSKTDVVNNKAKIQEEELKKIVITMDKYKVERIGKMMRTSTLTGTMGLRPSYLIHVNSEGLRQISEFEGYLGIENYHSKYSTLPGEMGQWKELKVILNPDLIVKDNVCTAIIIGQNGYDYIRTTDGAGKANRRRGATKEGSGPFKEAEHVEFRTIAGLVIVDNKAVVAYNFYDEVGEIVDRDYVGEGMHRRVGA